MNKPPVTLDTLTRWEALDLMGALTIAMETRSYGTMCQLLGITDELVGDLPLDDITDIINVRLATVAKRAGTNIEWM